MFKGVLQVYKGYGHASFKWRLTVLSTDYTINGRFYPTPGEARESGEGAASDLNISIVQTVMPDV